MNEKIDILLTRYFSGEATEEEIQRVDAWIAESKENEAHFLKLSSLYQRVLSVDHSPNPDLDKAFQRFQNHIYSENKKSKMNSRIKFSRFYKVAVVLLLIATGIMGGLLTLDMTKPVQITAIEQAETYSISDAIDVRLTSGSQIEYKKSVVKSTQNEVHLKGTATFSVNSAEKNELLVVAGETFIKDIGTVFTVTADHPQEMITVDVTEGEVLFYTLKDKGIAIKEGERGVYETQTKKFTFQLLAENGKNESKEEVRMENAATENAPSVETERFVMEQPASGTTKEMPSTKPLAMETKKEDPATKQPVVEMTKANEEILFDAEQLKNVVAKLESLYNVTVKISPELTSMPISATFEKNENIEHILIVISETLSVRLQKDGDVYILSK